MRVKKSGAYIATSTYDFGFAQSDVAAYLSSTAIAFGALLKRNTSTAQSGTLVVGLPTAAVNTHQLFVDSCSPGLATSPANVRGMGGIQETTVAAIQGVRILESVPGGISSGNIAYYGHRR